MIDWDDVRFFLAVARNGSVRSAAEKLNVNHTTVLRRISHLERRLGARLFEKKPAGYQLAESGQDVLALAEEMELSSGQLERLVWGRDEGIGGPLRVAMAQTIATHLLMPDLAEFSRRQLRGRHRPSSCDQSGSAPSEPAWLAGSGTWHGCLSV